MYNILIIGATSSIAAEVAKKYATQSNKIFLISRSEDKCKKLKEDIGKHCIGYALADFNDERQLDLAWQNAKESIKKIDIALIAHGYLGDQIISESSFEDAKLIFDSNFTSVVNWLIKITNYMEIQGYGKIGVISSVAGERGRPRNYTYGAAKGALSIYLEGLRSKLWGKVEVYTFKLGPVDTPMTVNHKKNFSFSTKEHVSLLIIKAIKTKKYVHYVPGFWFFVLTTIKIMPEWLFQRLKFLSGR